MATTYNRIDREIQVSEATTAKRQVLYQVGTAQAQSTVYVRKAAGSLAASTSTATQISGNVFEITIAAADLDTEGELMLVTWGTTDSNYLFGMRVVDHDPFDVLTDIKTLLDTTGVALASGAITSAKFAADAITQSAIAANALAPEVYSQHVVHIGREIQVGETTTNLRTLMFPVGTAETQTVQVSKNGGAFGVSTSVASQVSGTLYKLVIDAADIDTLGEIAFSLQGATNKQYISGITVVSHDPHSDMNYAVRRLGKGLRRFDSSDDTIKTYDGATTAASLLATETRSTSGTYTDWTPS